ncbi:hypothetical protein EYF80_043240 [Liparis tanakae]|uniref:Uncharacterized protein n=1 Tax=Liparis tanakae TaxID=230148 RepID=A0A4Z2FZ24_9TELE|nr:hypothetical protein EYF80_043240 [Liparis tanakae]
MVRLYVPAGHGNWVPYAPVGWPALWPGGLQRAASAPTHGEDDAEAALQLQTVCPAVEDVRGGQGSGWDIPPSGQ